MLGHRLLDCKYLKIFLKKIKCQQKVVLRWMFHHNGILFLLCWMKQLNVKRNLKD